MSILTKIAPRKVFYGWWIVVASTFFNFFVGGTFLYGFTAFFDPLRNHFGWTSAQTALGVSLQRLEGCIAAPAVGFLFDRVGPRKLILFGMIVAGCGLIYMSRIQSLVSFYVASLVMAVGLSFAWMGPPMYTVANWFIKRRSRALSFLLAGTSLGGLLVPLLVLFITQAGWRTSLMAVGIGFCVIGAPIAMIIKHRPEKHGYLPDGDVAGVSGSMPSAYTLKNEATLNVSPSSIETNFSVRQTLRTRAFWFLSLAVMLSFFTASAVMVLEMPHLENVGISREVAGLAVSFTTLLSLTGSLVSGLLGDVIKKSHLLAVALVLQCSGMFIFAYIYQPWHLVPFLLLYGIGFGATIPLRPAMFADYFGRSNIGTILGLMMSSALFGSVWSSLIAGWFFDLNGKYQGIFIIYAVALSLAIPAVLLAGRPALETKTKSDVE
ncbi:MFS transporter [Chloroflexota bacterium]